MSSFITTDCYQIKLYAKAMKEKSVKLEAFSQRFRLLMKEKGWAEDRREDVGKRLGVSGPAVTYWWNGDRLPTMQQAIILSAVFNCCVEWLLTGNGPKKPMPTSQDLLDISLLPKREQDIFRMHIETRTEQIIKEREAHYQNYNKDQSNQ